MNRCLLNYSHDEHHFQWTHSLTHGEQLTCANVPTAIKMIHSLNGCCFLHSVGIPHIFQFTSSSSTFTYSIEIRLFFFFKFNSRLMTCATIYVTNNHQLFWIINRSTIFESGLEKFKKHFHVVCALGMWWKSHKNFDFYQAYESITRWARNRPLF